MIAQYIQKVMETAHYEVRGEIPGFEEVRATGKTLEECRQNLEEVFKGWIVKRLITRLKEKGATGVADYGQRLKDNVGNMAVFEDLLSEAEAALMFLCHGFKVHMRESPDLRIELEGEVAYAEVKHFREKKQDRIDEKTMQESVDLVHVGNIVPREGAEAWEQIVDVAVSKAKKGQYLEDAPNLLVIVTDSNSVDGAILPTAVHLYDVQVSKSSDLHLHRLNAFVLMDQWIELSTNRNVYFCQTAHAKTPLSAKLTNALANIRRW